MSKSIFKRIRMYNCYMSCYIWNSTYPHQKITLLLQIFVIKRRLCCKTYNFRVCRNTCPQPQGRWSLQQQFWRMVWNTPQLLWVSASITLPHLWTLCRQCTEGIEPDTCSALWALERMSSQAVVLTLAMAELGLYRVQVSGEPLPNINILSIST